MQSRAGLWATVGVTALVLSACAPSQGTFGALTHPAAPTTTAPVDVPATTTTVPSEPEPVSAPTTAAPTTTAALTEEDVAVDLSDIDAMLADLDRLLGDLDSSFNQNEGDVTP